MIIFVDLHYRVQNNKFCISSD